MTEKILKDTFFPSLLGSIKDYYLETIRSKVKVFITCLSSKVVDGGDLKNFATHIMKIFTFDLSALKY